MVPRFRTQEDIRLDGQAFLRAFAGVRDQEIGAVNRTLNEAWSVEVEDVYYQLAKLLQVRSVLEATGAELDREAERYGVAPRYQPTQSTGRLRIEDGRLATSTLRFQVESGQGESYVAAGASYAALGPYNVRFGEGQSTVETVAVTSYDAATGKLVHAGTTYRHLAGERVSVISGAGDTSIAAGQTVRVPSQTSRPAIEAVTLEAAVIVNGDYYSNAVRVRSVLAGVATRAAGGSITQWASSPPFPGAGIDDMEGLDGGRNVETDDEFRSRILDGIQSLSRAIRRAVESAAIGVTDAVTKQRVATANAVHDLVAGLVRLYIDDGSGMDADTIALASSTLDGNVAMGAGTLKVTDITRYSGKGSVILGGELLRYDAVNAATRVLTLAAGVTTQHAHNSGDEVAQVDVLIETAEDGQKKFNFGQWPVLEDSVRIWSVDSDDDNAELLVAADYFADLGRGNGQLVTGLDAERRLVAHYTYATGLVRTVQRVVTGDADFPVEFPGVAAEGVRMLVVVPVVRRQRFVLGITAKPGFTEASLYDLVREAVEQYLAGIGIGEEVVMSEVIAAAMGVPGVYDVIVIYPLTTSVPALENEIIRAVDAAGNSMVSVR